MKKVKSLSWVAILAFACVFAPALHAKNYKIIVVAGQSNSGNWGYWGDGPLPENVKTWINSPACDGLILTDDGDADSSDESLITMYDEQLRPTNNQGYPQIVAYAADQYWKAIDPDSQIVVVYKSVGATALDFWSAAGRNGNNPYSDGSSPYGLYYAPEGAGHAALFSRIQKTKALLAGSPIEGIGFIWYQGEGNAGDGSGFYFRNFLDLVNGAKMVHDPIQSNWGDDPGITSTNGIRQELGNPDMPFVVARISSEFFGWGSNFGPPNWEPSRQVTRADQVNATRELSPAAFINVDDRPVNDGYHYQGSEYSIIGQRFADTWTKLANSPTIRPERTVFTGTSQQITMTAPPGGATVYYTTDGSTPTSSSTAYSAPFALDRSATLKAIAYRGGTPVGPVVEKRFTKLAALPAQTPTTTAAGLRVRAYLAETAVFPGFETAVAPYNPSAITQTRISRGLLAPYGWNIFHCTAYINIPQDDVYEFQVTSGDWRGPDPSYRIIIDDAPVDRYVALKAGLHAFRFDKRPPNGVLSLWIKGGTYTDFTVLPPEIFSYETTGGNPVSFEVSRLAVNLPAAAGSLESVFVTSDVASWTASSNQPWLTVSPNAGAYHETLALTAQANSTGSARTATVTLSGSGATTRTFSVTQAATDASPIEAVVTSPVDGATTTLAITTAGAWSLKHESNPWFDCEPSSGTGNTTVTIRARKNPLTSERTGWVQLDTGGATSQRVKIRQSGEPAFFSPSATALSLTSPANTNPVTWDSVVVRSNVNWTATTSTSWLNVNAASQQTLNGSGNGRVWFLANAANAGAQPREGTVTITSPGLPSQNITVIQPGTAPFLAAMPTAVTINRGDAATFIVSSNQASWDGTADQPWLTVSKSATANQMVLIATPNTTGAKRTANVTVTSGTATPVVVPITQNAAGKFLAFDPAPRTLGAGANQSATVLVDADEDWSVTSVSAPWLNASAGLPVSDALAEPLLREHTPGLAPATEKKLRRLLLSAASANTTGASRQANIVMTSSSGATLNATVTQSSNVLSVDTGTLPNGTVNAAYSQTLQKSGGEGPFTWAVTSGSLPAGLSLSAGGVINGTPTTQGTSNFTVTVTDLTTATASRALSLNVDPEPVIPPTITTTSLTAGTQGFAYYQTLVTTGGVAPLTWTISSGSLPTGLTLSSAGVISGNPSGTGTSNFTVLVTDILNSTDTQALSLLVSPPVVSAAIYEGFNYSPGTDLATQTQPAEFNGWAGGHSPGYTPVPGSLAYVNGGTLVTSGNALSGGNVWQTTGTALKLSNAAWTPFKADVPNQWGGTTPVIGKDNTTLYVSFLMQCTNHEAAFGLYTDGYAAGEPFSQLALGPVVKVTSAGAVTLRVASYTSGTFDVIPGNSANGVPAAHAVQDASGGSVTAGSVNLYVLKIEFGAAGNGQDKVSLFVNPTVGGAQPGAATASITANGNLLFTTLATFLGNTAGYGKLDEVRFAATWADAVPAVAPALTGIAAWFDSYGLPTDGTGNGAPTAILAADGITNLMKYALGIDPAIAGYQGRLTTGITNVSGSDYLSLTYARPEPAPTGVTYTPQVCSDLSAWSGNGTVEVSSTVGNGLRSVTVRDGTAVSAAPRRFLRLKVTAP